jgi:hypothetical protein
MTKLPLHIRFLLLFVKPEFVRIAEDPLRLQPPEVYVLKRLFGKTYSRKGKEKDK